ncbi:hypothetical protein ED28_02775 [[Pantoea] beijingensis]|uniref:Uncharacterized protein n=2 Tax=[Pantoea] beijingensis TaxID=1324864 RepID=A0A443IIU3_9GAMM|nr:hypothetical protein ED28_02775 [[Pantoea] beijingensis]
MEMIMNLLLLLVGAVKAVTGRLTIQEWGYLFSVAIALLRGIMAWRDNRAEQRRRTAILLHYSRQLGRRTIKKIRKKLQQMENDKFHR